jgi:AhpD family alkylhydroperoxidase
MEPRLNVAIAPKAYQVMAHAQNYIDNCGLEHSLLELVKTRASQINGCGYCIDMHTKDARARGETEQRLYLLNAWREAPFYSDRERAALEWTEAVTLIAETHAPDDVYERVRQHFTPEELVNLTLAITTINSWNRLSIAFRATPGTYQPRETAKSAKGAKNP